MNLVIVESPAKAKTIERYLGKEYKVLASMGHLRDLPKKKLGVDVKKNYQPDYEVPSNSKKIVASIKKSFLKAHDLFLATDLDREGEAISWHLLKVLGIDIDDKKAKRITFSEITKSAINKAVKNPRSIDMNLVNAQQARRVLDRLVGYKLSPLLWRKVKSGLSAGRVQSVAVRLIVEREREIKKFKAEEYWIIAVTLSKHDDNLIFKAILIEKNGKRLERMGIKKKEEADKIVKSLKGAKYKVVSVNKKDQIRRPAAPFTTSTLQMEASRKLNMSAKQTMRNAQKLYEAGHITYMRTDSINLSKESQIAAKKIVEKEFGKKYLPELNQKYKTRTKRAQEAHEAIRPTHFEHRKVGEDSYQQRLYELIWKRTVASQMKNAIFEIIEAKILAKTKEQLVFFAKGETVKFDGFIKVYTEGRDDEDVEEKITIPDLVKDQILDFHKLFSDQKFTEPPKRYSEATLVKKLESLEIGRPSTYAPTMSTIEDRGYVTLLEKRFYPTEIAMIVNDLLVKHFNNIVDYKFSAKMEDDLDRVAEGNLDWVKLIDDFYKPFAKNITEKNRDLEKKDFIKDKKTDQKCPKCKKPLVEKLGKYGKFLACSGYPDCKYSRPIEDKKELKTAEIINDQGKTEKLSQIENEKCPKCGSKLSLKEGKFGKFLACENYPKCKYTKSIVQGSGIKCPECKKGELIIRHTKRGKIFWGCSRYPKCKYATWVDPKKKQNEKK